MIALTYTLQQLQEALQEKTQDTARNRIALLEREHGFPPRLPGYTARWSRPAVDHWFRTWGGATTTTADETPAVHVLQLSLEKTYG